MMMMKLFPRTQIDQILQELKEPDTKINLVDFFYQNTKFKKGVNNFDFEQLETNKIFHLNQIKKVCIDYRLRFLDLKYFKGNIPKEDLEYVINNAKTDLIVETPNGPDAQKKDIAWIKRRLKK